MLSFNVERFKMIYTASGNCHYKAIVFIEFLLFLTSFLFACILTDNYDQSLWFYSTPLPIILFYVLLFLMIITALSALYTITYLIMEKLNIRFIHLDKSLPYVFKYTVYVYNSLVFCMLFVYVCFCVAACLFS